MKFFTLFMSFIVALILSNFTQNINYTMYLRLAQWNLEERLQNCIVCVWCSSYNCSSYNCRDLFTIQDWNQKHRMKRGPFQKTLFENLFDAWYVLLAFHLTSVGLFHTFISYPFLRDLLLKAEIDINTTYFLAPKFPLF